MNQTVNMNFDISTNNSLNPQFLSSSIPQILNSLNPYVLLAVGALLKTF